jgi:hypothetical protein
MKKKRTKAEILESIEKVKIIILEATEEKNGKRLLTARWTLRKLEKDLKKF